PTRRSGDGREDLQAVAATFSGERVALNEVAVGAATVTGGDRGVAVDAARAGRGLLPGQDEAGNLEGLLERHVDLTELVARQVVVDLVAVAPHLDAVGVLDGAADARGAEGLAVVAAHRQRHPARILGEVAVPAATVAAEARGVGRASGPAA